ncbi:hypothetical protein ACFL1P_01115 [Patescibacteria group bacterium]
MKKVFIVLVLLLIISTTFIFSFLYISFNFSEPENNVNQLFRKRVMKYPILRKILRLQQVGDGRYEYMYHRALPLEIYLYYQEGVMLEDETLEQIKREMLYATNKYASVTVHPPITLSGIPDHVTDEDVDALLDQYGTDSSLLAKTVPLHIFVLNYFSPVPSFAGLVSDAHSMMLFKDAMYNVSDTQEALVAIEISTILHEFAHLGGAEHIDNPDCILADTVESLNFFQKISDIRDSYCQEDFEAINRALEF